MMADSIIHLAKARVLTADISLGRFDEHIKAFADLGAAHRSSYVCCVNAHMTVEARAPDMSKVLLEADLATADGMPVLRALQLLKGVKQERVAGNDILPALLVEAEKRGLSVYFYGGQGSVLNAIVERLRKEHAELSVVGLRSPPFRALSDEEMQEEADRINASGAHIVMVSLGCPKQEQWMAAMKGRVNAVMLGLGGAFLLYAGVDRRAPKWMRDLSLEWTYRLWLEPGRLWKRYLVTNSIFLWMLAKAMFGRVLAR